MTTLNLSAYHEGQKSEMKGIGKGSINNNDQWDKRQAISNNFPISVIWKFRKNIDFQLQ